MERTEIADKFKIRASGCSNIMGAKGLGDTGKTFAKEWLKEYLYNRSPEIKSKYIEKGNQSEEDGFTLMATELNLGMVYKNTEFFSNDFMTGTPDLIVNGTVYDNKCSWSLSTFPMFDDVCKNKDYYWQLQTYMELTGCKKAILAYTLIDAPEWMVEQAVKWEMNADKVYKIISEMVYTKDYFDTLADRFCSTSTMNNFVEIPEKDRIKTFEFSKNEGEIALIKSRVFECRTHLKELLKTK